MSDQPTTLDKIAAEVLGTFVLVFFGCGAALMSDGNYVATGLTFGLTVVVMAYAVGRISGGHFNPAVTLGAAVGGRLPWREVGPYIGAQLTGAVVAGASLWVFMHGFDGYDSTTAGLAQNAFGDQGSGYAVWAAFLLELVLTGVFLMVILAVTDSRNEHPVMAPLTIGLALAMIHFASMGATGTSVNPARSIGVGLFAGGDAVIQLWLFILAPLLGAAAAGLLYPVLFGGDEPLPGSGLRRNRGVPGAVPGYGARDQYQQQWNQPEASAQHQQAPQLDQQGQQAQQGQPPQYGQYSPDPYGQDQYGQDQYQQQWNQQQYPPGPSQYPQAAPSQYQQGQNLQQYPPPQQWPAQDQQHWQQQWGRPGPHAGDREDEKVGEDGEDGRTQVRPDDQR